MVCQSLAERELWVDFLLDFSGLQVVHIDVYAIYQKESVLSPIALGDFGGARPSLSIPVTDGMIGTLRSERREMRVFLVILNYERSTQSLRDRLHESY